MKYPFIAPVNGASQYQDAIRRVRPGDTFSIRRQPDNPYDSKALAIYHNKTADLVGYLPAALAARIEEDELEAEVCEIYTKGTWGLRLNVHQTSDTSHDSGQVGAKVLTRGGRELGDLVRIEGDRVVVTTEDGEVGYPTKAVQIIEVDASNAPARQTAVERERDDDAGAEDVLRSDSRVA